MEVRYCEFTGDSKKAWDEVPRRVCEYAGFSHCILHDTSIKISADGWRVCCDKCETPKQVKLSCPECDGGMFIYDGIHHEVQWGGKCNKCGFTSMFDKKPPIS